MKTQNPNEIENIADSSSANDNLSYDMNLNTECEIDNSKISRENQAETGIVSKSEIDNTHDPARKEYITFETKVWCNVMKLDEL